MIELLRDHPWQPLLGIPQDKAVEVEPGVDLRLLIHKGEGQAHRVLDPITAPDAGDFDFDAIPLTTDEKILMLLLSSLYMQ